MKFLGVGRGRVSRTRKRPRGLDERQFNHGVLANLDYILEMLVTSLFHANDSCFIHA